MFSSNITLTSIRILSRIISETSISSRTFFIECRPEIPSVLIPSDARYLATRLAPMVLK